MALQKLTHYSVSFQESILGITPAALFILLTGPRAAYLFKSPDKAKRQATYTSKLVRLCGYICLLLALTLQ